MTYNDEQYIAPYWEGFRSLWRLVAIILFLLLLIIWFLGCGPGGKFCKVPVETVEKIVAVEKIVDVEKIVEKPAEAVSAVMPAMVESVLPAICEFNPEKAKAKVAVKATCTGVETDALVNIAGMDCAEETAGTVICTSSNSENVGTNPAITTTGASGEGIDSIGNFTLLIEPLVIEAEPEQVPAAHIYFDVSSDQLSSDAGFSLEAAIIYLGDHSEATAHVSGFHDPSGNYEYNQDLSKRRAESVGKLLEAAGIPVERIILEKPSETTGTGEPEEARRVEVTIQGNQ